MIKIYFDTEFTDLVGIETDIKLISAGFVASDGRELYFELVDHYHLDDCSAFVHESVLPLLDAAKYGMPARQAAQTMKAWIESFVGPVGLVSDAPAFDWPLIRDLFDQHRCWSSNLAGTPLHVNAGNLQQGIENFFQYQPIAIRHHALWDARALAHAAKVMDEYRE